MVSFLGRNRIVRVLLRRQGPNEHDEAAREAGIQVALKEGEVVRKQDTDFEIEVTPWGYEVQVGHLRVKVRHIEIKPSAGSTANLTILDNSLNQPGHSQTIRWDSEPGELKEVIRTMGLEDYTTGLVEAIRAIYAKWLEMQVRTDWQRPVRLALDAIRSAEDQESRQQRGNLLRQILTLRHSLRSLKDRAEAFCSQNDESDKAEWRWLDEVSGLIDAIPLNECSVGELKELAERCRQMMPPEEEAQ